MKNFSKALILAALSVCACTGELDLPQDTGLQEYDAEPTAGITPGSIYIEFSDQMADQIAAGETVFTVSGIGMKSCRRLFEENQKFSRRYHDAGLDRWYVVEFDDAVPSTKAAYDIRRMDGVESVAYPHKMKKSSLSFPFNDTYSYCQWSLSSDGRLNRELNTSDFAEGCDINVVPVWTEFTAGSHDVIVAVMDGGVNPNHEDMSGVVLPFGEGGSKNFVTNSFRSVPDEHGANVAGIIGAVSNNGIGISGIAGGSDGTGGVKVMSCTIVNGDTWATDESVCSAFVWAADNGAVICNNSWNYSYDNESDARDAQKYFLENRSPIKTAIDYFIDYAGFDADGNQVGPVAGGTVVFSAGNDGFAYSVPACHERVIAVAAHGPDYAFASYSNFGDWVDIIAPGGDAPGRYAYRAGYRYIIGPGIGNNTYNSMAGTSQAAPHVTGVAALLASYFGGTGFTNDMLRERLLKGTRENVVSGRMTGPMLDAYGAFKYMPDGKITITTAYSGNYTIRSHENFEIDYNIEGNSTAKLPAEVESDCPSLSLDATYSKARISVVGLEADPGEYPVRLVVGRGTDKEVSVSFTLTILENHPPQVNVPLEDMVVPASLVSLNLNNAFSDPDQEPLTITMTTSDSKVAVVKVLQNEPILEAYSFGMVELTFTATDARGASASQSIKVLVRDTSKSYDVYPNPVTDYMFVRPGETATSVEIEITGDFGRRVISKTAKASPFEPVKLDLTTLDPGQYLVNVKDSSGKEFSQNIVKL